MFHSDPIFDRVIKRMEKAALTHAEMTHRSHMATLEYAEEKRGLLPDANTYQQLINHGWAEQEFISVLGWNEAHLTAVKQAAKRMDPDGQDTTNSSTG